MSKKKDFIIQILRELDENNKLLTKEELGIETKEEYGEIIEIMKNDNLITGVDVLKGGIGNKIVSVFSKNPKITIKGIEYLG